jgi:hypothetical protein
VGRLFPDHAPGFPEAAAPGARQNNCACSARPASLLFALAQFALEIPSTIGNADNLDTRFQDAKGLSPYARSQ